MAKFKVGDIVMLASGSPNLQVLGIRDHDGRDQISVGEMSVAEEGKPSALTSHRYTFPAEALHRHPAPETINQVEKKQS